MKHLAGLCLAVIAVAGCGPDPRESFVGDWSASMNLSMTIQGTSATNQSGGTLNITEGDDADEIRVGNGNCPLIADVTSDTSFTVQKVTCPPTTTDSCQQMTLTVQQGTGTRSGLNLNITLAGTIALVCNGQPGSGTFSLTWTASKKN